MRLRSQRLIGDPLASAPAAVAHFGAVQSQDYHGAKWALAQRTRGATSESIDALFAEGAFIRTHAMRPTWHFVAPADLRWLLALTGLRVQAGNAGRYRQLELDAVTLRHGAGLFAQSLRGGQCRTRRELAALLTEHGIDPSGQRLAYLLMHAELEMVICSGPLRGKQSTYALFDVRVPRSPERTREDALAELARRYLGSHGPATEHDFAWWSGLTVADARTGFHANEEKTERARHNGRTFWFQTGLAGEPPPEPVVHLLPNYDEHLVAYRDHRPSFAPEIHAALDPTSASLFAHIATVDGLVVGGWRRTLAKNGVSITLDLLRPLSDREWAGLVAAAEDYGSFLGLPVALER
jgi:hypothetical protein